jgi:glycosyltransferase involved in cell wall biosynthesis
MNPRVLDQLPVLKMDVAECPDSLAQQIICFAGNATYGVGGQGEFLRQMVSALDLLPQAQVWSRFAKAKRAECVSVPFSGFPYHTSFNLARKAPILRRRKDWLMLLSDLDFDRSVAARVGNVALFDGVMAQCLDTFIEMKRRRTPLVLTCQNTHIDNILETLEQESSTTGQRAGDFIHPRMRQRALSEIQLADRIRVSSGWAKQTFIERGVPPEKISVINPAVNRKQFYPTEKKDDVFRVMAVSSINPRKGIHYLLQAFEDARIPNSELVIIGGTEDRWSHLMLNGFLRRNSNIRNYAIDMMTTPVEDTYGSTSVLVHPALEDGYALVVPEALASGRPVIATRQTGAAELIEHGKNGFVVENRAVKELKELLQLLANDPKLLQDMSQAAATSISRLTYADFARDVRAFYQDVLNGSQADPT